MLTLPVVTVALILVLTLTSPASARAQSCQGTLAPVAGGAPNEARYSFTCDGPVEGSYTLSATSASGDAIDGTVQTLDPGFVCTLEPEEGEEPDELEEGEDPDETEDLSSWECVGATVAAGKAIKGLFIASQDPCAISLGLLVVTYRGSGPDAKATGRTLLTIQCPRSASGTSPPQGTTPTEKTPTPSLTGPLVSSVHISPAIFRAARRGPSVAAAVGARVRFTLSASARVSFVVTRFLGGVRSRGRCVARRKHTHPAKRCTRDLALGSFTRHGRTGANAFRFTGRLANRVLSPGEYRFAVTARSSSGLAGALVNSPTFRISR